MCYKDRVAGGRGLKCHLFGGRGIPMCHVCLIPDYLCTCMDDLFQERQKELDQRRREKESEKIQNKTPEVQPMSTEDRADIEEISDSVLVDVICKY